MTRAVRAALWAVTVVATTQTAVDAQGLTYNSGQPVVPAFEGWDRNPDGSFNMMFGYMNRNWQEQPTIPVGMDNWFAPGEVDRGQPTHFLPRRNRFVFKVRVPADFGERELVWTLRSRGQESVAIGSLRPDYFIDNVVIMSETGALGAGTSNPELRAQTPPNVTLESPHHVDAQVGQPVRLVAWVTDDGLPRSNAASLPLTDDGQLDYERAVQRIPSRITVQKVNGLHMSWFVYRAPDDVDVKEMVAFDPPQVHTWEDTRPYSNSPWASFWVPPTPPEDGRWITDVTFDRPGTYILRGRADDGGLYTDEQVTINVRGPVS